MKLKPSANPVRKLLSAPVLFTALIFGGAALSVAGQANGFGIKIGPTMGLQKWGGGNQRDPLFRYHIALFADSESSDSKNVIYGQLGYHVKGGAVRVSYFYDINGNRYPGSTYAMEFHNLSLDLGLKRFIKKGKWAPYYAIGLRGEYTLKTELELYQELEEWTRRWNYGVSVKLGTEITFNRMVHGGFELNLAPDLSKQVYIPASIRRLNPWTNQPEPGYEQSTVNTSVELSFYLRFMQIIEYE